jgi:hypothetical protein
MNFLTFLEQTSLNKRLLPVRLLQLAAPPVEKCASCWRKFLVVVFPPFARYPHMGFGTSAALVGFCRVQSFAVTARRSERAFNGL